MLGRALSYDDMACTHLHMPSAAGEALRALSGVNVSMLRYLLRMACAAPPPLMLAPIPTGDSSFHTFFFTRALRAALGTARGAPR